nr:hypothetical protein [Clostridia bacterium]
MNRPNVLFVLPFIPYPLISGGHQAIYNGIAILEDVANVFITYKKFDTIGAFTGDEKAFLQKLPFVKLF